MFFWAFFATHLAWAASFHGRVVDADDIAISDAVVKVEGSLEVQTNFTGEFDLNGPVTAIRIESPGYEVLETSVQGSSQTFILTPLKDYHLEVTVVAQKKSLQSLTSESSVTVNDEQIQTYALAAEESIPKLIASTAPGVVQGGNNQLFFRGSHGNVQYQMDGIFIPESANDTFSQFINPDDLSDIEVISGGMAAEFGQRLNAIINLKSKSIQPGFHGLGRVRTGSYSMVNPFVNLTYGAETLKLMVSGSYLTTQRGLNTPEPISVNNLDQGGDQAVHDHAVANTEFFKLDWQPANKHKFSFLALHGYNFYQIPNYPTSFNASMSYFAIKPDAGCSDHAHDMAIRFVPSYTNDAQWMRTALVQGRYEFAISENWLLEVTPIFRLARLAVLADAPNDLITANASSPDYISGTNPLAFSMDRVTNSGAFNWAFRWTNDLHRVKFGSQSLFSETTGFIRIDRTNTAAKVRTDPTDAFYQGFFVQDDWKVADLWVINMGLRFDVTKFYINRAYMSENQLGPRLGVSFNAWSGGILHAFYGRLFQPAAPENLRFFFDADELSIQTYDIKAEKDDYFEFGVSQKLENHLVKVVGYYAYATDMIDQAQLFNTPLSQPFNFAQGFREGLDLSLHSQWSDLWSSYVNYSWAQAKGRGISGGLWANDHPVSASYQLLDHVQAHTVNSGLQMKLLEWSGFIQALYSSGFNTGAHNNIPIRPHWTLSSGVAYQFGQSAMPWSKVSVSLDVTNILNDRYPITIANVFNGTQYAAGRQWFVQAKKAF
jgi:hypothetical protein